MPEGFPGMDCRGFDGERGVDLEYACGDVAVNRVASAADRDIVGVGDAAFEDMEARRTIGFGEA